MNFSIQPTDFDIDDITRHLNNISAPTVLTDDDCRIICKNSRAQELENVNELEFLLSNSPISTMKPAQVCNVPFGEDAATVLRSNHGCIAIINLLKDKKYFNLSGYDVSLESFRLFGRNSFEQKLFDIAFERLECLRSINPLSFFPPTETLNKIINLFQTEFPSMLGNIKLKENLSTLPSLGNEGDFALIASLIISFCSRYGRGAEIELFSENNSMTFSARTTLKKGVEYEDITDAEKHWFCLINLISEGNIWRFEAECDCRDAVFGLNLLVPDENDGFILCDKRKDENISLLARIVALGLGEDMANEQCNEML